LVLSQLEAQPWEYVKGSAKILPMYVRALTFPDYHSAAGTLLPPAVALYKRRWISDRRLDGFEEALFFKAPEAMFYAADPPESNGYSELWSYLDRYPLIVVESEGIMRLPKPVTDTTYYKGVILTRIDEQRIELSELFVDHPGRQLLAFGSSLGYGYTRHGGEIRRNITPSDCPCGNELWHSSHAAVIGILAEAIRRHKVKPAGTNAFSVGRW
jgi:hypothetical protein